MDTTGPLFFVLFVVAAMLLFEAAQSFIASRRSGPDKSKTKKRLQSLAARIMVPEADEERSLLRKEQSTQGIDGWISALPFAGALELLLYRAGMAMSVKRFIGISIAIGAAGLIAAVAFLSATPASGIGVFAGSLPWLQARRLGRKRAEAFEKQFPDALDLLIRALRAGHALTAGLQMVGEELQAPISEEFMLTADEIQLGKDVTEALSNMSYRVESSDLPFFVVAITIQQETGSNLAEVLENLSHVIRERFKLYGKVRALTALGRATANLLAVWPVVMVGALYSVNPDYIAPLWEDPTGHTFAIVAFFMIIVGYVLCRRMAKIQV